MVKDRFYWPDLSESVREYCVRCKRCCLRKTPLPRKAPLTSMSTSYPLELVCIDFLTLPRCYEGFENVLVINDHFTKLELQFQREIR
ncbi:hypothetical protein HOLleu_07024 [Holothuria leucospilota]|uniref:Integrase zinc-binding domain-containing protein n=1 Tax=Holothuria leucospilota TaxID=206669 RepID=A0A9Q1HGP9_HOLLE|nr:hypothetical protein HOLleu_07024 [Holothuria leucospilota]